MLGFDAIGRLALGQVPSGTVQQAITGIIGARAFLKVQSTSTSAITGRSFSALKSLDQWSGLASIAGKIAAEAKSSAPGGLILKASIRAQAKAKATPGYLLYARMAMNSSALGSPHIEGTIIGDHRDPLLLNPGSQYGASYWRGRG